MSQAKIKLLKLFFFVAKEVNSARTRKMLLKENFYSILCTALLTTLVTLCSGFVLSSSAAGQNNNIQLFGFGESLAYQWKATILLNEVGHTSKNVGFFLDGKVLVSSLWGTENKRILKLELNSPQLHVKSRQAPSPNGFIAHSSRLDTLPNRPVLLVWNKGLIDSILIAKNEIASVKNLKKGLASLFQLQVLDGDFSENDVSGRCNVTYVSPSPTTILKTKSNCTFEDMTNFKHPDTILGAKTDSIRTVKYTIDNTNTYIERISENELHQITLSAREDLGNVIASEQSLTFVESKQCDTIKANSLEEAIEQISINEKITFAEESLLAEKESFVEEGRKMFSKEVNLLREDLKTEHLGSSRSAKAFLQLLKTSRISSSEDISKALESKKNIKILPQLYDILGYTQTKNSHKAVMKKLHLDSEEQTDRIERYLWALSFSTHPNVDIMEDLFNKYRKYTKIPEQIRNTLILSLASMARTLAQSKNNVDYETSKVLRAIEDAIVNGLDYAQDEDRYVFFSALKNLKSPSTIPNLVFFIKNGTLKEEMLAWKAIRSFGKDFWTDDLLRLAEKTLYQLERKHDTSSRTIAADILVATAMTDQTVSDLLKFVASNDTNYEVKQYVFQSIKMLAENDDNFKERVQNIIKGCKKLNNYSALSPRGLSTALTRSIFKSSSSNGSLVSVQEIKGGIVKRGAVDIVLDKNGIPKELFTLGIFSAGLNSFLSSNDDEEDDIEESSTAGMELTIMGTQIRPFVFFEGQGELMGHVWSGTASEMTPAFQSLIMLNDHEEYLRLGTGFVAEIDLKGAVSFDLSGKIEISLWNRNAKALVEKSAGFIISGLIKVHSSFVTSKVEFEASIEPKLSLQIDADFSSNVKLCMRLSQPDSLFGYSISKIERIPGSKHQIKITKNKKSKVPGTTYALNRKNDEMCSEIFS